MQIKFLVAALVALASCNAVADTPAPVIVIKFSHVVASDAPKGQAAERFKATAEKLTKGRVRVEVYPMSTLVKGDDELVALQANTVQMLAPSLATFGPIGVTDFEVFDVPYLFKDKEEMEALQLGAVQMLAPSLAKFGPLGVKEFEVFDLPFLFVDQAALTRATQGPVGKMMLAKLEPKGIKGLAFWNNGFKQMTANKPLHVPADFKGMKMRIQSSKVLDAQFRAVGWPI